jgi:hypothetical protein
MLMIRDIYSSDTGHTGFPQKFLDYNIESDTYSINLGVAYALDLNKLPELFGSA